MPRRRASPCTWRRARRVHEARTIECTPSAPYTYFTSDEPHLGEISRECSRAGAAAAALWLTMELRPPTPDGLAARAHPVTADVPRGRILRSVLMEPEVEPHVPPCTSRSWTCSRTVEVGVPEIVDHDHRRVELIEATWRTITDHRHPAARPRDAQALTTQLDGFLSLPTDG